MEPRLEVGTFQQHSGERKPLGWIYAYHLAEGRPNHCVYIWTDGSWTLAQGYVKVT